MALTLSRNALARIIHNPKRKRVTGSKIHRLRVGLPRQCAYGREKFPKSMNKTSSTSLFAFVLVFDDAPVRVSNCGGGA